MFRFRVLILFFVLISVSTSATSLRFVTQDTSWSGSFVLDEDVFIKPGKKLTILPGTHISMNPGISVQTDSNCVISIVGNAIQPIVIEPAQAGSYWCNFLATRSGSSVELAFADVSGGQIKISNGATGTIQDCFLHDFNHGDIPIIYTSDADSVYISRTHVSNYYEMNIVRTPALVEDCLFEFTTADAIDFDNAPQNTLIRNTTIRYGRGTNIDAIDFGKVDFKPPGSRGRVENCMIHDFSDKGVSVGEGCLDVVVTGCLIFRTGAGVAVKDSSIATIYNNTFYNCDFGIELVEKNPGLGGGHGLAYNNIIWGNGGSIFMNSDATLNISYSNIIGNTVDTSNHIYSVDPLFSNIAIDDYSLSPTSPLIGVGINGEDLGAVFPVGGIQEPANELRLGHPQSNMELKGDSIMNIYWSTSNAIQSVDLSFSTDNGNTWSALANNLSAQDGSWQWHIPNIYSTRCMIRLFDHDDTLHYVNNFLPFSILPSGDTTAKVTVDHDPGFYHNSIDVAITAPPGSIVYYTLDGSVPTDRSFVYQQPIHIEQENIPVGQAVQNITASNPAHAPYSYVHTAPNSYVGPSHNFWDAPNVDLFKGTVLRARTYTPGQGLGVTNTSSYFIDTTINESKYTVPVVSLATDPSSLFDYFTGIYIPGASYTGYAFTGNYELSGRASERTAHFEYFDEAGERELSQNVGIRIRGEWIRNLAQKSLTVYARTDYDEENNFNYAFFPGLKKPGTNKTMDEFKRIILRTSGNEFGGLENTMCEDALTQSLFEKLDLKYQPYRFCQVFINGEYWGLHLIRELFDERGVEKNYDLSPDSIIMMEDNLDGPFQLKVGNADDTLSFHNLRNRILQSDWSNPADYEFVKEKMDVSNFTDYWAATIYSNKKNANHNQAYWRLRNGQPIPGMREGWDGRWRWVAIDFDNSLEDVAFDNLSYMPQNVPDLMLKHLLDQPEFKVQFINRFADLLNSSFSTQYTTKRIDEVTAELTPEIGGQIGRWRSPVDFASWTTGMQKLYSFATNRTDTQRLHIQNYFSLPVKYNLSLDVDDPIAGIVKINSLAVNNDLPGVSEDIYPWTGVYFNRIPVTITAQAAYGYKFDHWKETGITDATIFVDSANDTMFTAVFKKDESIVSTGVIMYPNPSSVGLVSFEKLHRVSVFNAVGQKVLPEQTVRELNISNLSAGVYFVRFETGDEKRLVIVK